MTAQAFPAPFLKPPILVAAPDAADVLADLAALAADIEQAEAILAALFARRAALLREARGAGITLPVLAAACHVSKQAIRYAVGASIRPPRMRREQARRVNARRAAATRKAG